MKRQLNKSYFILSLINLILFLLVGIFVYKINSSYEKFVLEIERLETLKKELIDYISKIKDNNCKISIYIKDLSTQHIIDINSKEPIPAASIIKIPIMTAVYYLVDKGEISLDDLLTYKKKHRCGGAGIIKNYHYGKKYKVKELIDLMISISDNVATHMLIDYVGMERLNLIFKRLGLKNTNINRYVMDLVSRDKGIENYTTAEDIGMLLEKIYKKELISREYSTEMLLLLMRQKITDRIPKKLPKEVVVAHKTGLMRNVCHDTGIVYTKNGDFIICVLIENINCKLAKDIISEIAYKTYSLYDKDISYTKTFSEKINGAIYGDSSINTGVDTGGN
ncbi:MAG: serine hydrolase [Elusimicrobiota bacterium]|nr:class A beta-lactamase-related serine hydrolase [Endomicrobiia bacterium]MDW8165468.1 serine hydrolase [Elusimicrobiota bacterium]